MWQYFQSKYYYFFCFAGYDLWPLQNFPRFQDRKRGVTYAHISYYIEYTECTIYTVHVNVIGFSVWVKRGPLILLNKRLKKPSLH